MPRFQDVLRFQDGTLILFLCNSLKKCRKWRTYRNLDEWKDDVDTIVNWFTREDYPINFVAWYIAEPDHTLHRNGFFNGAFVDTLKNIDQLFGYLMTQFRLHNLDSEVNIILTSDHGHAQNTSSLFSSAGDNDFLLTLKMGKNGEAWRYEISGVNSVMCIGDYIDLNKVYYGEQMIYVNDKSLLNEISGVNSVMCIGDYIDLNKVYYGEQMIYVNDKSLLNEVYRNLTDAISQHGFKVKIYTKNNLPLSFHYDGRQSLIGDIILSPKIGAEVRFDCKKRIFDSIYDFGKKTRHSSAHGMEPDNPEMRPILVLRGPDIYPQQMVC
ncbi:hypothetical protein DICVIV_07965 [Dictyocaulus viviparus]|uniref:Uncharacterized protein n=1 Tax=Dictyocaulus viviparus TaxID=29172 RepID=A0A0D8XQ91_DICVI|nr:hypothetical protein DICVIV_07965 [Dictyocaulus viviparus]